MNQAKAHRVPLETFGRIYSSLAIDPSAPETIYAAGGGVIKSTDGGIHWTDVGFALPDNRTRKILLDPTNSQTLYVVSQGSLFKSTNGGTSWTRLELGMGDFYSMAIDPTTPQTLYAATAFGAYKSTDGGANWKSAGNLSGNIWCITVDPNSPQNIYAGKVSGIYKSSDGGDNWSSLSADIYLSVSDIVIIPQTPQIIYAIGSGLRL